MLTARRKSRPGLSRQRSFPIHANPRTLSVDIGGTGIKVTGELPAGTAVPDELLDALQQAFEDYQREP